MIFIYDQYWQVKIAAGLTSNGLKNAVKKNKLRQEEEVPSAPCLVLY